MIFRVERRFAKRTFSIIIMLLLLFLQACDKKSDSITDAVMAPYGSTVEMGSPIQELTINSTTDVWFIEYRIFVLSPSGEPMNGIGLNLSTSSPYVYFGSTGTSVALTKTEKNGGALVIVWVLGGQYFSNNPSEATVDFSVWADIIVNNDVRTITLTNTMPIPEN